MKFKNLNEVILDKNINLIVGLNNSGKTEFIKEIVKSMDGIPLYITGNKTFTVIKDLITAELQSQKYVIVIDNFCEGLDYQNTDKLTNFILDKVIGSKIKLVMATNSKEVMNIIPIKFWQICVKEHNEIKIYNQNNSQKYFEDFEEIGLTNFDFFRFDFFTKGWFENVTI